MAKRNFIKVTKTALIGCAVVTALSVVGVGYAAWNDSLSIVSKISTGEMDVIFSNVYFNNNPNGDKKDTGNKKYNDISLAVDSSTILISGTMYYANDIVLKYEVVNKGTVPVEMTRLKEKKYEFENKGFIIINPNSGNGSSGTIKIHIPQMDGEYNVEVPMEFELQYGSWKETLYIKLDIMVELANNKFMLQELQVTTSSPLFMNIIGNNILNESTESLEDKIQVIISEKEIDEPVTTTSSPTSIDISKTLEKLSEAVIVDSKANNEVDDK